MWPILEIGVNSFLLPPNVDNLPSHSKCQKRRELPWEPAISDTAVTGVCPNPPTSHSRTRGRVHFSRPNPRRAHREWTLPTLAAKRE